ERGAETGSKQATNLDCGIDITVPGADECVKPSFPACGTVSGGCHVYGEVINPQDPDQLPVVATPAEAQAKTATEEKSTADSATDGRAPWQLDFFNVPEGEHQTLRITAMEDHNFSAEMSVNVRNQVDCLGLGPCPARARGRAGRKGSGASKDAHH